MIRLLGDLLENSYNKFELVLNLVRIEIEGITNPDKDIMSLILKGCFGNDIVNRYLIGVVLELVKDKGLDGRKILEFKFNNGYLLRWELSILR